MRQTFSTSWIASRQPRKQRKYAYNAPLHVKHSFLSAHLSKDLRVKHKRRNLSLRKGDEVLVMRGTFAGKKAKISSVDVKRTRAMLEGITRPKRDGSKVNVFFHPSNLQITALTLDDKKRLSVKAEGTQEKKNAPNKI